MAEFTQRSFGTGEAGPAIYPRADMAAYATGLRTARNVYGRRHGGVDNRAGTVHMGEIYDSTKNVRLIPYVITNGIGYTLELSGLNIVRVLRNGEYIKQQPSQSVVTISNTNPCVVTYSGSDTYVLNDMIFLSGIDGPMGQYLNNREFKLGVVDTAANTFVLRYWDGTDVDSTSFGAYTSGGTIDEFYYFIHPYSDTELADIQFSQSGANLILVHPSYAPRIIKRTTDISWSLLSAQQDQASVDLSITLFSLTGSPGTSYYYQVTAVSFDGDESKPLFGTAPGTSTTPSSGTPVTISWTLFGTAPASWRIYRSPLNDNKTFNFVGSIDGDSLGFTDSGVPPDASVTPPKSRGLWSGSNKYPRAVGVASQRLWYGGTNDRSETIWASTVASFQNLMQQTPIDDSSSIEFTLAGQRIVTIRHIIDLGSPVIFTDSSEFALQGDGGVITPTALNPKQYSENGSSRLRPLIVDSTALYVQARGSAIRDLNFDYSVDGYKGNDLTILNSHLFDGHTIVDWTYAQTPHSIIWAVRDDGVLLSLTYIRDQNIRCWTRHDFEGGIVENVCAVPEGTEDALYLVVRRTINGRSVRYVERMQTRLIDDRKDMIFMDSSLTYDGRNTGSTTMTISGGTTWAYDETLTLTASASHFESNDVGDIIQITGADGTLIQFTITGYTSATVVTGNPDKTVPVAMRSTAFTTWAHAVDTVSGLWHLEGQDVSVLGDGVVVGSPNNPDVDTYTVTNGSVTLDAPYGVIHVGLPYVSDIQTLDIETPEGMSLANKKKLITEVTLHLEDSIGIFVGTSEPAGDNMLDGLFELKLRELEGYDEPTDLFTGKTPIIVESNWNTNGRVFIRQVDPLPMSLLAISPSGFMGVE